MSWATGRPCGSGSWAASPASSCSNNASTGTTAIEPHPNIGATDLLLELTTETALTSKVLGFVGFVAGLGLLLAAANYL